jgi:dual specificity phosphatase 12
MDKITDAIWIGNYLDAGDRDALRTAGIKSILCLDGCMNGKEIPPELDRVEVVELIDGAGNSPEKFLRAVRLLKELSTSHGPVLVHCHAGQSRSAAVVCKHLMQEKGKTLAEAMKELTSKRKVSIVAGLQEALDF